MLNTDKIRLMNELATFEKHEGSKMLPCKKYFKKDFIAKNMMQSFFVFTFCAFLVTVIRALYKMEQIVNSMRITDLPATLKKAVFVYLIGLVIFEVITWRISVTRYDAAKRLEKKRMSMLVRLNKRYELQNRTRELAREGRNHA